MIVNSRAVVLTRQDWGESDRLVSIYTEEFGRVRARCVGVNKPGRKMKALCEPFVWAEFRLHMGHRSDLAKIIGGQIISSFPRTRSDYGRILTALSLCEIMNHATPEHSPNPLKYDLIVSALRALENGLTPWLAPAFGLRLLDLAGQAPDVHDNLGVDDAITAALLETEMDGLGNFPYAADSAAILESAVAERVESYAGRKLRGSDAVRQWRMEEAAAMEAVPC